MLYPVLQVPTVLEEGPNHVLEIDIGHELLIIRVDRLLQSIKGATRAVELVTVAYVPRTRLNVPYHGNQMSNAAIKMISESHSHPHHARPRGKGSSVIGSDAIEGRAASGAFAAVWCGFAAVWPPVV
jgi:hypothetical protein